ncbi:NAD(P)-binding protein [Candidatus Mycalebacterium sp.]
MPKRNIENLICGNSIAALVCGEQLLAAGKEVLVLSPNDFIGGHFRGIDIDNFHYDIGMNFFEFTAYGDEPSARIESYNPEIKNDSGRFVSHVKRYVDDCLGVKTVQTETPKMYFGGNWYEDFFISDRLESLSELPSALREKLAKDIKGLETPEELHARNKNRSKAFMEADFEKISRANHGDVFHEEFIEPLCRKITGVGAKDIMAYYHRLAWMPVFYPETLKSHFSEKPQPLAEVKFSYPVSGRANEPIDVLTENLKEKRVLEINPIASGGINSTQKPVLTLENGDEIHAENFVWANDWTQLSRTLGNSPENFDMANITCAFFETDADDIKTKFSTAFIVDGEIPCYRITQPDYCAGKKSGSSRICMEFNTDNLENRNSPEECWKMLVDLGVIREGAVAGGGRVKHFRQSLLLATVKNYKLYSDMEKLFAGKKPPFPVIGGGSFSATSFNDQVVQGMKAASYILENS